MTCLATAILMLCQAQPGPMVSPEVHADRTVTFRLRAPKATEAVLNGEWSGGGKLAMTKDDQGIWSLTVGPLEPDVYGYSFTVDGLGLPDPLNSALKPMRSPRTSVLWIPGSPSRLWDCQDVPHGTIRLHDYFSKTLSRRRPLRVYTPPGYDQKPEARFPVLYLLHGSGDTEATWTTFGHAHWIEDNLLAEGKAKAMLIVMLDGHAVVGPEARGKNLESFGRDLLDDAMPFVEANYRTVPDREARAIVGLSMGGGQSLTVGLNNLDRFAWVGGFSSAIPSPQTAIASALGDPAATNAKLKLLWFACGKDDGLSRSSILLSETLKEKGIRHDCQITEGNHSWPVWRRYLGQFLPLVFADAK